MSLMLMIFFFSIYMIWTILIQITYLNQQVSLKSKDL